MIVAIVGSNGTVGSALFSKLCNREGKTFYTYKVITLGRDDDHDVYVDMTNSKSYEHLEIERITELLGGQKLDALVFCQGINPYCGINDITSDDFIKMYQVNIVSNAIIVKQLQHLMKDSSTVIMLGSIAARKGSFDPAYATAKAAMHGLINSLAIVYRHIRFNLVSPGLIKNSRIYNEILSSVGKDYIERTHTSHMHGENLTDVNDVVSTIMMIINNKSIASTEICVDGGFKV